MKRFKFYEVRSWVFGLCAMAFAVGMFAQSCHLKKAEEDLSEYAKLLGHARWEYYDVPVNDTTLSHMLISTKIRFPAIVHAQAVHESNFFKSDLAKNNNNLFGMKYPGKRITAAVGELNGYAYYAGWTDSVVDYAMWFQVYCGHCKTEDAVYKKLDSVYAEHAGYSGMIRELAAEYSGLYNQN